MVSVGVSPWWFDLAVLPVSLAAVGLVLYFVARRRRRNLQQDTTQPAALLISWRAVAGGAVVALLVYGLLLTVLGLLLTISLTNMGLWDPADPSSIVLLVFANVPSALGGFGALLLGGYLSGRWAARRGGTQGLLASGGFLLLRSVFKMVVFVVALARISHNLEGITLVGAVEQLVFLVIIFVGGYLGGRLGERHGAPLESAG